MGASPVVQALAWVHSRINELAMSRWRYRFVIQPVSGLGVQELLHDPDPKEVAK